MTEIQASVIIPAAGLSQRMGKDINKQFLDLNGVPILIRTVQKFEQCKYVNQIIIGINEDSQKIVDQMIAQYSLKNIVTTFGGSTRQATIHNCLSHVSEQSSIVIVHDAVRPFVTLKQITDVILVAKEHSTAILAISPKDTIKYENNNTIKTLDRNKLWLAHTPQAFSKKLIFEAYNYAKENSITATDDASLVEEMGHNIYIVPSSYSNIKITTQEDLEFGSYLLNYLETIENEHITPTDKKDPPLVTIYTDGACSNNPGPGGYGIVLLYNGIRKEISKGFNHTTNNRMEILAIIDALSILKIRSSVVLYSDSKYVIDAITKKWVYSWKKNNWIRSNKEKALNIDLWQKLLPLLEKHSVKFVWVKGHANNVENERCDTLAREAINNPNKDTDINEL